MRRRTADAQPGFARLGSFWFGIQVVWGAILGVSLQARCSQVEPLAAIWAYGMLAASGAAVAAFTQIAAGLASDARRFQGSRRLEFYVPGAMVAAGAICWFYLAPSFAQLLAALLVLQLAMNTATGPYQAAIPDFVEPARVGSASSWMAGLQSIGNAVGALMAGLLADTRLAIAGIAGALLASCALCVTRVRGLPLRAVQKDPLRVTRAFVDLFISRALMYTSFYTVLGYLYFYIARTMTGNAKLETGIILLVFTAAGALGAAAIGSATNRFDRRAMTSAGGLIFAASLAGMIAVHAAAAIVACALIAGGAWGVFLTADWALGCAWLPRGALATAMGVWNLALLSAQIIAPLLATAAISLLRAGTAHPPARIAFALALVEVLLGVAWIWRLPARGPAEGEALWIGNTP